MASLQKIADIDICGEKYELAANGSATLVERQSELDAYGTPIASIVDIGSWSKTNPDQKIMALLDLLVTAYRSIQSNRDARLNAGRE